MESGEFDGGPGRSRRALSVLLSGCVSRRRRARPPAAGKLILVAALSVASFAALPTAIAVASSPINYPSFSSTAGLTLNGSAAQAGSVLRLTPAINNENGSAFTSSPEVDPTKSFDSRFEFSLHDSPGTPADGITFTVQRSANGASAEGGTGGDLGYGG